VHHCLFCGWWRSAEKATIVEPACERCGCTLRADTGDEFDRVTRPPGRRRGFARAADADVTGVFAVAAALPLAVPAIGIELGEVVFALPLVLLIFAAVSGARAARIHGERRSMWIWLTLSIALAACASGVGLVDVLTGGGAKVAFYLGSTASVALLAAVAAFAVPSLLSASMTPLIDAAIVAVTGCADRRAGAAPGDAGRGRTPRPRGAPRADTARRRVRRRDPRRLARLGQRRRADPRLLRRHGRAVGPCGLRLQGVREG
jgi:hypothetical protein